MATYQETLYANNSYLVDMLTEQKTYGAQLPTYIVFNFSIGNSGTHMIATTENAKGFVAEFPARSPQFNKKRITNKQSFVYVASKSSTGSGSLPPGSEYRYGLGRLRWTGYLFEGVGGILFQNITNGAYLDITELVVATEKNISLIAEAGVSGKYYMNTTYAISSTLTLHGHTGTNKPYMIATYEDIVPYVKNVYPQSGFVDENKETVLGWTFDYSKTNVAGTIKQGAARVRWRPKGTAEYTEISIENEQNTCTIPAGTFSTDGIEWQVIVTSDDGVEGTPSPWYQLSTVDALSEPITVSPKSVFCDGAEPIRFVWDHVISTGSQQTAFDLQYSDDNGATWENIEQEEQTSDEYHTVPKDILPAGTLLWRVRTYNTDDLPGSWSEAATIIVQAAPPAPTLAVETISPRPAVSWQSIGQQAYQVTAGGYDSGTVYGTAKRYKIPAYLNDGPTTIAVRVQNAFGIWSEWAEIDVEIINRPIYQLEIRGTEKDAEITLTWETRHAVFYVYRDGALIGKTTEKTFTDKKTIGKHKYNVRGAVGDYYDLSNELTEIARCKTSIIADMDALEWIPLHCRRGAKPEANGTAEHEVAYQHYSGRRLPVAEISEFANESVTYECSFFTWEQAQRVCTLMGKTVILKTPQGRMYAGVMDAAPNITDRYATDVAFTIKVTDCKDVINYDV